mmetsp:Transcript_501/g.739  ORF Transcript_501/g.739 Transcript_501/m.739 type:complete len:99 (+) Transcript_501:272-568(+)
MQAEKALCMQLFSLTDGTMISVHRLHLEDVETKKELDWSNATALFPGSEIKGGKNGGAAPAPADLQRLSESDILLDYPEEEERQSICRKLLGLIFGWD